MNNARINSFLTHPNTLTLFRIISAPVIVILLLLAESFDSVFGGLDFQCRRHYRLF